MLLPVESSVAISHIPLLLTPKLAKLASNICLLTFHDKIAN
jgi:hypothetical protein